MFYDGRVKRRKIFFLVDGDSGVSDDEVVY